MKVRLRVYNSYIGSDYPDTGEEHVVELLPPGDGSGVAPGTLNTTATAAQSPQASEALSGAVNLHKIAKTGNYNDLNGRPAIPAAPGTLNTNNTAAQTAIFFARRGQFWCA
jgi:hypothetical protein